MKNTQIIAERMRRETELMLEEGLRSIANPKVEYERLVRELQAVALSEILDGQDCGLDCKLC